MHRHGGGRPSCCFRLARVSEPDFRDKLRKRLRAQRETLSPHVRMAAAQGLVQQLERLPEFLVDQRVAGYWAVSGEVPLHIAANHLHQRGQQFYLPVTGLQRRLRFALYRSGGEIAPNRYGIPEPQVDNADLIEADTLELVLIPLVAFDRHGHRLGFGGGFYDTSFAFLRSLPRPASTVLVGVGYAFQEVEALAPTDWDVPLDFVATERELIACTTPA